MARLTKQQGAFYTLVSCFWGSELADVIGENHPTVKWFRRKTGLTDIVSRAARDAAYLLREDDKAARAAGEEAK